MTCFSTVWPLVLICASSAVSDKNIVFTKITKIFIKGKITLLFMHQWAQTAKNAIKWNDNEANCCRFFNALSSFPTNNSVLCHQIYDHSALYFTSTGMRIIDQGHSSTLYHWYSETSFFMFVKRLPRKSRATVLMIIIINHLFAISIQ